MFKPGMMWSLGACALLLLAVGARAQQAPTLPVPKAVAPKQVTTDDAIGIVLQLTPPPPERLFQFKSEQQVRQQNREDLKAIREVDFPPSSDVVTTSVLPPRVWPYLVETVGPAYVCHKRLWFEQ